MTVDHQQQLGGKYFLCSVQFVPVLILQICFGGNLSALAFHTMDSVFDDAVLVHTNLLCDIYCWPLTFQLQPIM